MRQEARDFINSLSEVWQIQASESCATEDLFKGDVVEFVLAGGLSLLLMIYLVYVIFNPERF